MALERQKLAQTDGRKYNNTGNGFEEISKIFVVHGAIFFGMETSVYRQVVDSYI